MYSRPLLCSNDERIQRDNLIHISSCMPKHFEPRPGNTEVYPGSTHGPISHKPSPPKISNLSSNLSASSTSTRRIHHERSGAEQDCCEQLIAAKAFRIGAKYRPGPPRPRNQYRRPQGCLAAVAICISARGEKIQNSGAL